MCVCSRAFSLGVVLHSKSVGKERLTGGENESKYVLDMGATRIELNQFCLVRLVS